MRRDIDEITERPAAIPPVETAEEPEEEVHYHLSPQSIWPITAAAGIALSGAGFVTNFFITAGGVIVLLYAIFMWVQELRHEPH